MQIETAGIQEDPLTGAVTPPPFIRHQPITKPN